MGLDKQLRFIKQRAQASKRASEDDWVDKAEDDAVILLQYSWRRYMRRWEQQLAAEFIQQAARSFVASLRGGRRARKRQRIRAPPTLLDEFE